MSVILMVAGYVVGYMVKTYQENAFLSELQKTHEELEKSLKAIAEAATDIREELSTTID